MLTVESEVFLPLFSLYYIKLECGLLVYLHFPSGYLDLEVEVAQ